MLKIYSGYHLAHKTENITFDIRELQPQQEIIDIVTQFIATSKALDDENLDVGISTTNPLVIQTIEAIAMEKNVMHNLKYVYITKTVMSMLPIIWKTDVKVNIIQMKN